MRREEKRREEKRREEKRREEKRTKERDIVSQREREIEKRDRDAVESGPAPNQTLTSMWTFPVENAVAPRRNATSILSTETNRTAKDSLPVNSLTDSIHHRIIIMFIILLFFPLLLSSLFARLNQIKADSLPMEFHVKGNGYMRQQRPRRQFQNEQSNIVFPIDYLLLRPFSPSSQRTHHQLSIPFCVLAKIQLIELPNWSHRTFSWHILY